MSAELRRTIQSETDARHTVLEATLYSQEAGFDETPSRMIATVVSELTRNILKYAGHGKWSYEEDIYNPAHFQEMIQGWLTTRQNQAE